MKRAKNGSKTAFLQSSEEEEEEEGGEEGSTKSPPCKKAKVIKAQGGRGKEDERTQKSFEKVVNDNTGFHSAYWF